jgi:dihydrofolate synthase/folylpolyglutamate synthase
VVAERDFSWQVEAAAGLARWSYHGLRVALRNLPPSALEGSIQYRNASAAIAAIESLDAGYTLNEQTVSRALRDVRLAGRFQVVPGPVEWILDIAHNEPAARVFAGHVRERGFARAGAAAGASAGAGERADAAASARVGVGARADAGVRVGAGGTVGGRTFAVVGILADKDAREIAAALEPLVDHWILCSLPGARGSSASDLANRLRLPPDQVTLANSVEEGCEAARAATVTGDRVIVFGSVYTVGPALQWLRVY